MKFLAMLYRSYRNWLLALAVLTLAAACSNAIAQTETATERPAGPATEGVGLMKNEPGAYQGYTLLSPLQGKTTYLMDMQGRVVKTWKTDRVPASSAYLLENGNLMRAGEIPTAPYRVGPAIGGRVQEFTWDGELVWDYSYYTEKSVPHHDYTKLPNGNVMLIIIERKKPDEAIAAGRVPATVSGGDMSLDALIEIKPTGKATGQIVWEWHMWDHLIQDWDPTKANFGEVAAHPELIDVNFGTNTAGQRAPQPAANENAAAATGAAGAADASQDAGRGEGARGEPGEGGAQRGAAPRGGGGARNSNDWTHTNAVAYNADLDQLMISIHNHSEVWIIDHSTTTEEAATHKGGRSGKGGDLLYRWGNPLVYRAGDAIDQRLFVQHNAHWIPKGLPGAGHMLVFNNGHRGAGGQFSSVDEIVLPVDANGHYNREAGEKFGPEFAVWSYTAPTETDFYSSFISGASRLPNGNTLICSGANGFMFEVTPDKQVVWQYNNPPHGQPATPPAGERGAAPRRGGGGPNAKSLFRAYRYGNDFPGFAGKELKPEKTLEEHAAPTQEGAK